MISSYLVLCINARHVCRGDGTRICGSPISVHRNNILAFLGFDAEVGIRGFWDRKGDDRRNIMSVIRAPIVGFF